MDQQLQQLQDLSPEELQAILGTDYDTVLSDILRRKSDAEERSHDPGRPLGQLPSGHVYFDPGGAIQLGVQRYRAGKDAQAAKADMDRVLGQQTEGRKTFANALMRRPTMPPPGAAAGAPAGGPPMPAPPPQAPGAGPTPPAAPAQPAPPATAPGAPPALQNAAGMAPDRLKAAGVPDAVMALIAKLRNRG